jgi:hypothetical protein
VNLLRETLSREGVPELTRDLLPLAGSDGHTLALTASGLCHADAYYRCPYDGGALFVLIRDPAFPQPECDPVGRVATVFPQTLAALPIADHRVAWLGYLASYGLSAEPDGDSLVTVLDGVPVLRATFCEQHRLTHLEAEVGG